MDLPCDIILKISMDHLGLGEFLALSWSSWHMYRKFLPYRHLYITHLKFHIHTLLTSTLLIHRIDLTKFRAIIAGSELLRLINRETWIANDLDIWIPQIVGGVCVLPTTNPTRWYPPLSPFFSIESYELECKGSPQGGPRVNVICVVEQEELEFRRHVCEKHFEEEVSCTCWGKSIVESFDAHFLQSFYDGNKLVIMSPRSLGERSSPYLYSNKRCLYESRGYRLL
jgi:hypothetical protein